MPELMKHQREIRDHITEKRRSLVFAEPGAGKTAAVLTAIRDLGTRAVVLCPKSIMVPAWVRDCEKFTPELTTAVATAPAANRAKAFRQKADVTILNHDGAKWLQDHAHYLNDIETLVIDESTAVKNPQAQRSRAVAAIRDRFDVRVAMTGTPMSNGILDVWHQAYIVDDGEHLGARYYAFRAATHDPVPVAAGINEWRTKPGAEEVVADLLSPIALRYRLEDCVDLPKNRVTIHTIQLPTKLRKSYDEMAHTAALEVEEGDISSVHAAALRTKLLQIASGSVYGDDREAYKLGSERYDLTAELVAERPWPSIIGFQWKHQRDGILQALERAGIDSYAVLDGEHNRHVDELVERFQNGEYKALVAHPKTAGHGLTFTKARTVIFASPTSDAELYEQLRRRVYRTGQTGSTETILIAAENTVDEAVCDQLTGKITRQDSALAYLQSLNPQIGA